MSGPGAESVLRPLRDRIDAIDDRLVSCLAERMACVDDVLARKRQHGIPARLDDRVEEVVARVRQKAERLGAPAELAELLWRTMIDWIILYEDRHLGAAGAEPPKAGPEGDQVKNA